MLSKTDLIELHLGTNAYKVIQTSCNSTFLDQKLNQDQSNQIHSLLIGKDADIPAFLWPQIGIFHKILLKISFNIGPIPAPFYLKCSAMNAMT